MNSIKIVTQSLLVVLVVLITDAAAQTVKIDGVYYREKPAYLKDNIVPEKTANGESVSYDSLTIIKPDFLINSLDGEYGALQSEVHIACDSSGNTGLTWIDMRNGRKEIFAQFFDKMGNKIGNNVKVNENPLVGNNLPFIAANKKGDFVITWSQDYSHIVAQKFTKDGEKTGTNFYLNIPSGYSVRDPCVAINDDGSFLALWNANYNYSKLVTRVFHQDGTPAADEITINNSYGNSSITGGSRAATDGSGNYIVVWCSYNGTQKSQVFLQNIDPLGNKINDIILVSDTEDLRNSLYPNITATDDGFYFIAWTLDSYGALNSGTAGRIYKLGDDFVTGPIDLKINDEWEWLTVSSDRKNIFIIHYYSGACALITKSGELLGSTPQLTYNTTKSLKYFSPYITNIFNGEFYVPVTLQNRRDYDLYLQKFNTGFSFLGSLIKVNDDQGSSWQKQPLVYFNKQGKSIVLWEDWRDGRQDLYARVFDENSNPVGEDILINETNKDYWALSSKSAGSLSDGTFVIAFTGANIYSNDNVYMQKVNIDGNKSGNNLLIKETYDQLSVKLNTNSDDEIMICWYNYFSTYIKKYNKNFVPLSAEKNLALQTFHNPYDIDIDTSLNILAVWGLVNSSNSELNDKIFGVIYNQTGTALSDTIIIDLNGGSIHNVACAVDQLDYVIAVNGNYLKIIRGYRIDDNYIQLEYLNNSYIYDNADIVRFQNKKLLITFLQWQEVNAFFFNDNKDEQSTFNLLRYDGIFYPNVIDDISNTDIFDDKLFFAYEKPESGTGFNIWGNIQQVKNMNFNMESPYNFVNDDYLFNNFPNPFNGKTIIPYKLLSPYHVKLTLYDILGREVKVIVDEFQEKGFYEAELDASGLSSGVYIYKLDAFKTYVKKMIILK